MSLNHVSFTLVLKFLKLTERSKNLVVHKWWIAKKPMWNAKNWSLPKNGELWNGELWSGELRGPPVVSFMKASFRFLSNVNE